MTNAPNKLPQIPWTNAARAARFQQICFDRPSATPPDTDQLIALDEESKPPSAKPSKLKKRETLPKVKLWETNEYDADQVKPVNVDIYALIISWKAIALLAIAAAVTCFAMWLDVKKQQSNYIYETIRSNDGKSMFLYRIDRTNGLAERVYYVSEPSGRK